MNAATPECHPYESPGLPCPTLNPMPRMSRQSLKTTFFLAIVILLMLAPNASAITIIRTYLGGTAPTNTAGAGNLHDIFEAAAHTWESAFKDEFTLTLYYGWGALDSAGAHSLVEQGGNPLREAVGIILFDNSGAISFFMDPTPHRNEEYGRLTEEFQDLGGGLVSAGRIFRNPVGEAAGRCDLYSVAVHEIGHALGMSMENASFIGEAADGLINIAHPLPFAESMIPLSYNIYGVTSHFDCSRLVYGSVMTGINADERRIPSALDILAIAQISGFEKLNLELQKKTEFKTQIP
jgi:hypothetical protein